MAENASEESGDDDYWETEPVGFEDMFYNEETGEWDYLDEDSFSGEGYSGPEPEIKKPVKNDDEFE